MVNPKTKANGDNVTAARARAAAPAVGRQRNTKQAAIIEAALGRARGFRTASELFTDIRGEGERVGLTTVYRHLTLLAETGRADVVTTLGNEAQYRLCGPSQSADSGEHHHHIVCRVCGSTVEVSAPEVEAWATQVAAAAGFTEITHTVELLGLCPAHSAGGGQASAPGIS